MKADDLLRHAADVIGDRGKLRDNEQGERSMQTAVRLFEAMTGIALTELEGWRFMIAVKLARAANGQAHLDDYIDLAGYAALAGECIVRQKQQGVEHG